MTYQHICPSSHCDCGISRRDWLRVTALSGAAAAPLLRAGDAMAQASKGDDVPVRIGYLPITAIAVYLGFEDVQDLDDIL